MGDYLLGRHAPQHSDGPSLRVLTQSKRSVGLEATHSQFHAPTGYSGYPSTLDILLAFNCRFWVGSSAASRAQLIESLRWWASLMSIFRQGQWTQFDNSVAARRRSMLELHTQTMTPRVNMFVEVPFYSPIRDFNCAYSCLMIWFHIQSYLTHVIVMFEA